MCHRDPAGMILATNPVTLNRYNQAGRSQTKPGIVVHAIDHGP